MRFYLASSLALCCLLASFWTAEASSLRSVLRQFNPILYSNFVAQDFDDQGTDMDDQEETLIVREIERVLSDRKDYSNPTRVRRFVAPPKRSYRIIQDLFEDYTSTGDTVRIEGSGRANPAVEDGTFTVAQR